MSDPADLPLSFYPRATGPKGTMLQLGFSGKPTLRDRSVSRRFIRESSRDHYSWEAKEGSLTGQREKLCCDAVSVAPASTWETRDGSLQLS